MSFVGKMLTGFSNYFLCLEKQVHFMISFNQCFPKRILCHAKAVNSSFIKNPQPANQILHCIKTLTPNPLP